VVAVRGLQREDRVDELVDQPADSSSASRRRRLARAERRQPRTAAGRSIVRAIEAAVSPSMLIVVMYCSSDTS
jgi:hypothetical protein